MSSIVNASSTGFTAWTRDARGRAAAAASAWLLRAGRSRPMADISRFRVNRAAAARSVSRSSRPHLDGVHLELVRSGELTPNDSTDDCRAGGGTSGFGRPASRIVALLFVLLAP